MRPFFEQRGAVAIEFAFILPILGTLFLGIVEFGLIMYNQQVITNASREGARAGIVAQSPRLDDSAITGIVGNYTLHHLVTFGTPVDPSVTIARTGTNFQDDLTVNVTYPYTFLIVPNFIPGLPNPLTLTAQSVMKYE